MLKEIPEYPSYYADELGYIYGTKNQKKMYKLTPYSKLGYLRVRMRLNGCCVDKSVAYLVARAFVSGYKEDLEVNHINKIRDDNRPENLEWMTHKENARYSLCRKLKVTTKAGTVLYYDSCGDFSRDTGIATNNLARWYMQKKNGYIKKFELTVEYIEEIV